MDKLFIRNIKMRRHDLGMTQKELAKRAQISQSTVTQIESGKKSPSIKTLCTVAKALKLEPHQLLMPGLYAL